MADEVVESLEDYLEEMDERHGWPLLFQNLLATAIKNRPSTNAAKAPDNKGRNRYRDVLPGDETRFKLAEGESDYINANYVRIPEVSRSYILTQGPLPTTAEHFWQMVWEEKTRGIAMLNHVIEKNTRKCHQYWPSPDVTEDSLTFGQYRITHESSDEHHAFRINHLRLEKLESKEEPREVLHFHYTDWPDFGVPRTAESFLDYLWAVRESGSLDSDVGNLLVHCSAGIGRSGTFCLVDVCLKQVELTGSLDGPDIEAHLSAMRRQRFGLIQTPDQLRFAYMAIAEGIRRVQPELSMNGAQSEPEEEEGEEKEEVEKEEDKEKEEEEEEVAEKAEDAELLAVDESSKASESSQPSLPGRMSPMKRPHSNDDEMEDTVPPKKQPVPLNEIGPTAANGAEEKPEVGASPSESQSGPAAVRDTSGSNSVLRERRQDRQQRLSEKVETMKERMRNQEASRGSHWSSYLMWPLAAVALLGGAYTVYRYIS